jgi:hypothetical protein
MSTRSSEAASRHAQVWNHLSNAIKFTAKGGRIQVRLRREQSYVELVVADDGTGMGSTLSSSRSTSPSPSIPPSSSS